MGGKRAIGYMRIPSFQLHNHETELTVPIDKLANCGPEKLSFAPGSMTPIFLTISNKIPNSGLPWWLRGKESAWQHRRHGFDP